MSLLGSSSEIYFQDYIGVRRVQDGIIELENNRCVTMLEINPINFKYKSNSAQDDIIAAFERWLRIAPFRMQLKSVSKKADLSAYFKRVKKDIKNEAIEKCREVMKNHIDFMEHLGSKQGVDRDFYIIIEYTPKDRQEADFNSARDELHAARMKAANYLRHCGNEVVEHENEDKFVIDALYTIINREKNSNDLIERTKMFYNRAFAYYNGNAQKVTDLDIPVADLIAPDRIEFHRDYIKVNNTYYSFLYLPSTAYKTYVEAAWLSGLTNAGEGIDIDIFIEQQDKAKVKNKLHTNQRISGVRLRHMDTLGENFEKTNEAYGSGAYIKEQLSQGENFYYVNTLITVTADSLDGLRYKVDATEDLMNSCDFKTYDCRNRMQAAYQSYLPFCRLDRRLFEKSKRNVTTSGLSAFYNFASYEISDEDGLFLGVNPENDSLCFVDNFNTKRYKNANIAILGTTGAGKTFTLQTMAMRYRMKGIQTFIITPDKGHEYRQPAYNIGGEFISISSGSPNCINVMEIRPVDKSNEKLIDGDAFSADESQLARKIDKIHTFFKLIYPNISLMEKELLDAALIATYADKDITRDNTSLIKSRELVPDGYGNLKEILTYKEMPILEDLYNVLSEKPESQSLAVILKRFVHGSASSFNGQTNVDLSNKYIVIDVTSLAKDLLPIGMFVAVDYVWDKVQEDRTRKKVIMVDETWKLINSDRQAAEFVAEIFKVIRGYAGAAIAATQNIADCYALEDGFYGRAIINNSKIKMLLQLEEDEAQEAQERFGLSIAETRSIKTAERGQVMVLANSNTFSLKVIASPLEQVMFCTDANILRQLLSEHQQLQNYANTAAA